MTPIRPEVRRALPELRRLARARNLNLITVEDWHARVCYVLHGIGPSFAPGGYDPPLNPAGARVGEPDPVQAPTRLFPVPLTDGNPADAPTVSPHTAP